MGNFDEVLIKKQNIAHGAKATVLKLDRKAAITYSVKFPKTKRKPLPCRIGFLLYPTGYSAPYDGWVSVDGVVASPEPDSESSVGVRSQVMFAPSIESGRLMLSDKPFGTVI